MWEVEGPLRIYWLAFLLTGHRERSFDLATEALDLDEDSGPSLPERMPARPRRAVIAKALAGIRHELTQSARRLASKRAPWRALPPAQSPLAHQPTKLQLEQALMALDTFPRCALLLSIFEGISLEDSAVLLDAEPTLVLKGRTAGLWDLIRNLAGPQTETSTA